MERVLGIGGFFFASDKPEVIARWYQEHLGITGSGESYDDPVWVQAEGETGTSRRARAAQGLRRNRRTARTLRWSRSPGGRSSFMKMLRT